jgi:hypothetical protein
MDKPVFSFQDVNLSAASAGSSHLRLIVGTEGFSMAVTDGSGALTGLNAWHFKKSGKTYEASEQEIRQIFGQGVIPGFPFGQVTCAFSNQYVTLVPRRLFREEDLDSYLRLLIHPAEFQYHYDELGEMDCFVVYAIEEPIVRTVSQYFPRANKLNLATSLIRAFRNHGIRQDYEVMVNLRNQEAQVMVFERQNLLFYNRFRFNDAKDLLYFLLLTFDQFRLNPVETPLCLAGNIVEDSDIYKLLYRYFRHIHFAGIPGLPKFTGSLEETPVHCFFDLLTL